MAPPISLTLTGSFLLLAARLASRLLLPPLFPATSDTNPRSVSPDTEIVAAILMPFWAVRLARPLRAPTGARVRFFLLAVGCRYGQVPASPAEPRAALADVGVLRRIL